MYGPFTFDWEIDYRLDKELTELAGMEVKLVAISAVDSSKEESLRSVLSKAFKVFGTASAEPLYRLPDVTTNIAASSDSSKNSSGKRVLKDGAVPMTKDSDSSRNNSGQRLKLGLNQSDHQPPPLALSSAQAHASSNSLRGKQKEELKRAATAPSPIQRTDTDKELGVAFQESWPAPGSARGTPGSSRISRDPAASSRTATTPRGGASLAPPSPKQQPTPLVESPKYASAPALANAKIDSPKSPKVARSPSHPRKTSRKEHSPRDGKDQKEKKEKDKKDKTPREDGKEPKEKEKKDKTPRDKDNTPQDKEKSPRDKVRL
jgi:hypothetical protein